MSIDAFCSMPAQSVLLSETDYISRRWSMDLITSAAVFNSKFESFVEAAMLFSLGNSKAARGLRMTELWRSTRFLVKMKFVAFLSVRKYVYLNLSSTLLLERLLFTFLATKLTIAVFSVERLSAKLSFLESLTLNSCKN